MDKKLIRRLKREHELMLSDPQAWSIDGGAKLRYYGLLNQVVDGKQIKTVEQAIGLLEAPDGEG